MPDRLAEGGSALLERYTLERELGRGGMATVYLAPQSAVHRLAAAEWLRETGDMERARRLLLTWAGGGLAGSGAWWWTVDEVLSGPVYLVRARLEESRDSLTQAAEFYQLFLRNYDRPMPSQVHLVEEARTALAHLGIEE